ncbi:MAG TPA: hypothetical protein VIJ93_04895 [bacterium]
MFGLLIGYGLGFWAWVMGFHCLVLDSNGSPRLSTRKFFKHLFKLFLWTVEIALLYQLLVMYRGWILQAKPPEIAMAFLVKSVLFLYIRAFWPEVFPEILPGLHVYFCPQCYRRQTFRFLPVSLKYGFFVTYLCRYCSCLVNAWGEQVFYPMGVSTKKIVPLLMKLLPPVLAVLAAGFWIFNILWNVF